MTAELKDWKHYLIKDLIKEGKLLIGDGYRAKNSELASSGLPFARAGNVNNGFVFDDADFFPRENLARVGTKLSKTGDVVFTSKGTVGRFGFVGEDCPDFVYSPQLCFWRSLDRNLIHDRWLYYWMAADQFRHQMLGVKGQTDMADYVSLGDQRRMQITLPSIAEQRAISAVLGTLDDKIEQNRRTAQALERLARAIFRAWFVDFEPVKAKAAGATSFPSMPQSVFDTLPNALVDSKIGPTPVEWEINALTNLCSVNPARSLKLGQPAPYLDMKNMPTNGHAPEIPITRPFSSGAKFTNGDTLVARITPCLENGKTAFVDFLSEGGVGWGSTEYIVLRPRAPLPPIFAYLLARTGEFRNFAIQAMTGTSGRQRVPFSAFEHFYIAQPPPYLTDAFRDIVEPLILRSSAATRESRKLAEIRDDLLPRLLSGRLRIETGEAG